MKRRYSESEKKAFREYAEQMSPRSSLFKDCIFAFLTGGSICLVGELLSEGYKMLGAEENTVKVAVPITLILFSCILTGLGIYEKIATKAGAGTLVPITGFANAVCSCAIDSRPEGLVKGTGAAMFKIAGPVIAYGSLAGTVFGLIYYFFVR